MIASRWTAVEAWDWYHSRDWLCGCNFLPSTAVNSTEFWQAETFDPETIDRELGWAADTGMNTVRVFLQYLVWAHDADAYRDRIDSFLTLAHGHGIATTLVLFDDCRFVDREPFLGEQNDPVPGVHNSQWTPSPGHDLVDESAFPDLERYVRDVVSSFDGDERVIMWDLYNEPGNSGMGESSAPLLRNTFDWARSIDPTQPVTAGAWNVEKSSEAIDRLCLERSDVLSFHEYAPLAETKRRVHELLTMGRPVVCTEWMARTLDSRVGTHLPFFRKARVGNYSWGLVRGRTQTHYPWKTMETPMPDEEPEPWFHDLYYSSGTPYDEAEIERLRELTS